VIKTSTSGGPALAKGRVLSRAVLFAAMALATFVMIHRPTLAHQPKANSSHQTLSPVQSDRQAKARPAEQVYKNIQIFKGLTVEQVDGAMFFMAASLGVGCNHCHSAAWEGDDNPAKQSARRMVEMMRGINKQNYSSNTVITCYTCHRGSPDPPSSPDAGPDTLQRSGIAAAGSESAKVLPSAGTLLEKYYSAMGGQAAIAKVKTQVLLGTETSNETGAAPGTAPIRIYREQPSKLRIDLQDPDSPHSYWVTGKAGWIKDTEGIRALGPDDIEGAEGGPDFSYFLKLASTIRTSGCSPERASPAAMPSALERPQPKAAATSSTSTR